MNKHLVFSLVFILFGGNLSAQNVITAVGTQGQATSFRWQHKRSGVPQDFFRLVSDDNYSGTQRLQLQFYQNGGWQTSLLVDKTSGYVGFGTVPSGDRLTVSGRASITGDAAGLWIDGGTNDWFVGRNGSKLRIFNENTGQDALTIKPNGSVGIGTTDPGSYKLAVEGIIGAREVDVRTGSWADFVFADDYVLPTLDEVEAYVRQNHHLPDMPSEAEVLAKGSVSVGAMQKLLLQKIEELTLYSIDLQQQLRDQQNQLAAQQRAIEQLKNK